MFRPLTRICSGKCSALHHLNFFTCKLRKARKKTVKLLVAEKKKKRKIKFKDGFEANNAQCPGSGSVTWFGFGEASSHGGPRNELGEGGATGDVGRSGGRGGGFVWSDPRAGLPALQVTQQSVQEKLQSHAGHRRSSPTAPRTLCR